MYCVLTEKTALRSWPHVPYAYYTKEDPYAKSLTKDEFEHLLLCDGEHDLEPDGTIRLLLARGLIRECAKGEQNSSWSAFREYENRYFPKMNFMMTGKCNCSCLHCFNAADNAPIMSEWSYEEALDLLDQAEACGVNAITITGGEPMLHRRFMDIVKAIYDRGMFVEELNTNGCFIDQQVLGKFRELGCSPKIKISFDGLGCHDWMRNRKGAEKQTLEAMELCIKNGFRVISQTQVHRRNLHTIMDTAQRLSDMGVKMLRLIRTTETPRWAMNAPDSCLSIEEYYDKMLDFAASYRELDTKMELIIWQFMRVHPYNRSYSLDPVHCADGNYNASAPLCKGVRGMVGVTSSKDVIPCLQLTGVFEDRGITLGSLAANSLKELLTGSKYLESACSNLKDKLSAGTKCSSCGYFKYCNGGCPALSMLFTGDQNGPDLTKCLFYENGWYQKCVEKMGDWRNIDSISHLRERSLSESFPR